MKQYGAESRLNARNGCQCCVPGSTMNAIRVRRRNEVVQRVNRSAKKAARQQGKRETAET